MSEYTKKGSAPAPSNTKPQRDEHADGLLIRDMINRNLPEHHAAIAKLYANCPHKVGFNHRNGKHEGPVTSSNVAAWAMKRGDICAWLYMAGVI